MDANAWLSELLKKMQNDINDIKSDVRDIRDFKLKIAGASILISATLTLAINAIAIWIKA